MPSESSERSFTNQGEPVRPIDPAAWVSHTAAMTGNLLPHYSVLEESHLSIHSDMTAIVKAMANRESGLEVRDRMWLKITIPNAFIGSDVVDWLHRNVEGFTDRREARKYAGNLLKAGYIRHTVNKVTFSEQCYYVFGDLCGGSRSSGSNCSDDGQKEGRGGSQSEPTKQEATASPDKQLVAESPGGDSTQRSQTSLSGLHSNNDSKDLPPALSPSRAPASRQSFCLAMGNPSDFFVDVM